MRRTLSAAALLAVALLTLSCGDRDEPAPTQPPRLDVRPSAATAASIQAQIRALFPSPFLRIAEGYLTSIRRERGRGNLALARQRTFEFVAFFLVPRFRDGRLQNPNGGAPPTTEQAVLQLIRDLYVFVGLPAPDIPDEVLADGRVAYVDQRGGRIVTPTGFAGIDIPAGALDGPVIVTLARLDDPDDPGEGPLPTRLKQYPLFYSIRAFPAVAEFNRPVRVGICQVADGTDPFHPPDSALRRLRLGRAPEGDSSGVEVLPLVDVDDFLRCADAAVRPRAIPPALRRVGVTEHGLLGRSWTVAARATATALRYVAPRRAFAAHGGTGGSIRALSSYGAVDPGSETPPPPGVDVVVINDVNVFDTVATADPNNRLLVRNLVNFTTTGPRGAGTAVFFDCGRRSPSAGFGVCDGLTRDMQGEIRDQGFTLGLTSSSEGTLVDIPPEVKVLVLWTPCVEYTVPEVNALKSFATEGGRIVIVGEHEGFYGFCILVQNDLLTDLGSRTVSAGGRVACINVDQDAAYSTLPATSLREHPITAGLTGLTLACSAEVTLATGDSALYLDRTGRRVLSAAARIDTDPITDADRIELRSRARALANGRAPAPVHEGLARSSPTGQ